MSGGSAALYARLLTYVRPHRKVFGFAVLGMIAAAATEPLFPALMQPLLDTGFGPGTQAALPPLAFAAAIVGIFMLRGIFPSAPPICLPGWATAWCSTFGRQCSPG